MTRSADAVVIGAGPAGLGAALALGDRALVLERGADAGGLSATVTVEGAVFDLGGHSFHTPHPEVRDLVFGALPMEEQVRDARCFVKGEWLPYPFQKHFEQLGDPSVVEECRAGLAARGANAAPRDLDQHLEQRHGAGVTRHFLRPYNEKLWGPDLTRLSVEWTAERMPAAADTRESFKLQGGARTPLQSDTRVAYPARGGYGEIFRALAARVPCLHYDEAVAQIDPRGHTLGTTRGERIAWRSLVSTLPLPVLLDLIPGTPAELRARVARLDALPLRLVMVALGTRLDTPIQRVYCAGNEIPGHKIVINHNSSDWLRATPRHGILVEVSAGDQAARTGEAELVERVIRGLIALGLLSGRGQVRATRVIELPRAYPVPTHERAAIVAEAQAWLAPLGIRSIGRFGEWAYINADEALHRGLKAGAAVAAEL